MNPRLDPRHRDCSPVGFRSPSIARVALLILALILPTTASPSDVHFSPGEGIRRHLLHAIRESRQQIDVAVYHITSTELAAALVAAKNRGVRVRVLTDQEKATSGGSAMRILREKGVALRSLGASEQSLMHHKFAVFDDRLVATGSYNWTNAAERANYENLVFLDNPDVVVRFRREFQRLWEVAKD